MEFIDFITNVGFPIVCCYYMFKHMTKMDAKNNERIDSLNKQIIEITEKTTKAIENNSVALTDLKDYIKTIKEEKL